MSEIIFNGPAGRLQGRYQPGKTDTAPVALILHPHPQYGGTMDNKVAYYLFHAFAHRGFATLRINFRGVGRSEGEFDNGIGELSDAASALDWLQSMNPNSTGSWVAGFSFGAWIGMQLLIAPPRNSWLYFSCTASKLNMISHSWHHAHHQALSFRLITMIWLHLFLFRNWLRN